MAVDAAGAPRFLIVRRDNIGDLVCTTPLLDALRARFPAAFIGALVNTYNAEVLARNPALDAVYAYEKLKHRRAGLLHNLFATARTIRRVRGERLDCAIAPSATPQAVRLAGRLRARRVLASDAAWELDPRHEVRRAFSLGASLGLSGEPGPMRVFPDPAKVAELRARLPAGKSVVAVHISARQAIRRWPAQRYAALMEELRKTAAVLLLWSPGAADDPRHPGDDRAVDAFPARENVFKVPTPDLGALMAALALADRVICPDGGAMHIAAALGKPIVALWADSPVERWQPWQVPHRVVQPPSKNLADLGLGAVLDAYAALARVG